mgnify:CR=1 FL=1
MQLIPDDGKLDQGVRAEDGTGEGQPRVVGAPASSPPRLPLGHDLRPLRRAPQLRQLLDLRVLHFLLVALAGALGRRPVHRRHVPHLGGLPQPLVPLVLAHLVARLVVIGQIYHFAITSWGLRGTLHHILFRTVGAQWRVGRGGLVQGGPPSVAVIARMVLVPPFPRVARAGPLRHRHLDVFAAGSHSNAAILVALRLLKVERSGRRWRQ